MSGAAAVRLARPSPHPPARGRWHSGDVARSLRSRRSRGPADCGDAPCPPAPDDPPLLPLAGVRVLDLADERAALGGRLLADLGAQVTLIEPPEGARSRGLAPFVDGRPGPDRSYQHLYFNANKESRVVDLATPQGIAKLRALAATADVLIETGAPGEMDGLGLGFADLRALNPQLIYVSATPYGQTGPRRDWKATDLTATAAGGLLHVTGDPADPPTHGAAFPAHTMTGLTVASSTMIALHGRDHAPGRPGAQLDISMQEATSFQLVQTGNPNTWLWRRQIPVRPGLSQALQCRDGRWVACKRRGQPARHLPAAARRRRHRARPHARRLAGHPSGRPGRLA